MSETNALAHFAFGDTACERLVRALLENTTFPEPFEELGTDHGHAETYSDAGWGFGLARAEVSDRLLYVVVGSAMRSERVDAFEEEAAARHAYGAGLQEMREMDRRAAEAEEEEKEEPGWWEL